MGIRNCLHDRHETCVPAFRLEILFATSEQSFWLVCWWLVFSWTTEWHSNSPMQRTWHLQHLLPERPPQRYHRRTWVSKFTTSDRWILPLANQSSLECECNSSCKDDQHCRSSPTSPTSCGGPPPVPVSKAGLVYVGIYRDPWFGSQSGHGDQATRRHNNGQFRTHKKS